MIQPLLVQFMVAALDSPPSSAWWVAELSRLLGVFEMRLGLPGSVWGELHDQTKRARIDGPVGYDLDAMASELRGHFSSAVEPGVHEELALLDIALARLGYPGATARVGRMVALSLTAEPTDPLDELEAITAFCET